MNSRASIQARGDEYQLAWERLGRLRRRERSRIIGFGIAMFAMLLFGRGRSDCTPLVVLLFVVGVALILPSAFALTRFRCPRCHSFFHGAFDRSKRYKRTSCDTCGLVVGTPSVASDREN